MELWDLSKLYAGYDSKEFQTDFNQVDELIKVANSFIPRFSSEEAVNVVVEEYLKFEATVNTLVRKVYGFISLNQSTNTTCQESGKYSVQMQKKLAGFTQSNTLFSKYIAKVDDVDALVADSEFLKDHTFLIEEAIKQNKYVLDDQTETLLSKLGQSSGSLWGRMQSVLTSTLEVEYDGKIITLPEVINLASDSDPEVRKNAYYAELASYKKIDKAVAFALNGIKGQVNTLTEKRGYNGALGQALEYSRMNKETLDAMIEAMNEYLPVFRTYLKRKAKLLGHKNGLPFYDIYAPLGSSAKEFTIPEAQDYILKNFGTFSDHLKGLAQRAFDNNWIDYRPYKGKVGGAFCSNIHPIKESRVLLNMTGSFSDVITMAHELGHAYHGDNIFSNTILNSSYTMPVAETASTFCETIVMKAALKDATDEEKLYLLDSDLQGSTQVIVDILSRFIFETSVFEGNKTNFLDENKLKELMLDAQEQTYGDGLDKDLRHPYMWLWKPHYYSAGLSFYNWPYAFGLLFAKGLYGIYQLEGDTFPPKYDELLKATGRLNVEDIAKLADIDVTSVDFWRTSLNVLKEDIDLFLELTK